MATIYVTRRIPEPAEQELTAAGHAVITNPDDRVLTHEELLAALAEHAPEAIISQLTDTIDASVFAAAPSLKICANYAVGYNNIDVAAAKAAGVIVTNTPGVLTDTVAEHVVALLLSLTSRIAEGDRFVRAGKYDGWAPMLLLGTDMKGATLGIAGAGRIGARVGEIAAKGLGMKIRYTDIKRNEDFEAATGAVFDDSIEALLPQCDAVTLHVPLLDSTHHLMNAERLHMMKPSAFLINASRGPVVDEAALVTALTDGTIKGAALDVYEHEPALAPGLAACENAVLTPHLCSASEGTRSAMADIAAKNVLAVLSGAEAPNAVAA
ncbi:MAG TPA: D-glycerate dehydrogenase [Candidatus Paceibacterota bacterium]|nr:D-glycerate dehydrogenase [Candidatus Paceibacterota bacterium]